MSTDEQQIRPRGIPSLEAFGSASVRARTYLWIPWAEVAIDNLGEAKLCRAWLAKHERGHEDWGRMLHSEFTSSLVSVSAAAHGVDAFYGAVKDVITIPTALTSSWSHNRTRRPRRILETLKLAFDIAQPDKWLRDVEWLFTLRDAAVHPAPELRDLVPHPAGTHTSPVVAAYSMETAERAVDFLLEVLTRCMAHPKANHDTLVNWCRAEQGAPGRLVERSQQRLKSKGE